MYGRQTRTCIGLTAALLISAGAVAAEAVVQTSRLGGSKIRLPAPAGFRAAGAYRGLTTAAVRRATPETNRLLDYYLSPQDLYRVKHGANAFLRRYMVVQTHRRFVHQDISRDQFRHVVDASRRRHQELVFQLTRRKAESLQTTLAQLRRRLGATFRIGRPVPLGVLSHSDRHLTMGYVFNYSSNLVAGMQRQLRIGTVSIVRVKNKLLFLYVYGGYESGRDLDWVKRTSRRWVSSILAYNRH